jgi:hypothetical protein
MIDIVEGISDEDLYGLSLAGPVQVQQLLEGVCAPSHKWTFWTIC